jgi:hypothetical protein
MKMQYARQRQQHRLQAKAFAPRCTCRGRGPPRGHGEAPARDVAGAHVESAARRQRGAVGHPPVSPMELPRRMRLLRAPPVVHRPPVRSLRQLSVAGKPATAARRQGHGRLLSRRAGEGEREGDKDGGRCGTGDGSERRARQAQWVLDERAVTLSPRVQGISCRGAAARRVSESAFAPLPAPWLCGSTRAQHRLPRHAVHQRRHDS